VLSKYGMQALPAAGDDSATHLAILTTPGGRRARGGAGAAHGQSAAFIYGVDVASGHGAVAAGP